MLSQFFLTALAQRRDTQDARRDSNLRPNVRKAGALTTVLRLRSLGMPQPLTKDYGLLQSHDTAPFSILRLGGSKGWGEDGRKGDRTGGGGHDAARK